MDSNSLQDTFPKSKVAFGVSLRNLTGFPLIRKDYHTLYGVVDSKHEPPKGLNPGQNATFIATSANSYLTGTSGIVIYKIGATHYHLIVAWSAPRNFYTHSNTLMVTITPGMPWEVRIDQAWQKLFNRLYAEPTTTTTKTSTKLVCDFGQNNREASYACNHFQAGMQLQDGHKAMSMVLLRENLATVSGMEGRKNISENFMKVEVKLLASSRKSMMKRNKEATGEDDKNHLSLVFDLSASESSGKKKDEQVLLCELVGKPKSKKEVNLLDANTPVAEFVNKHELASMRKTYGLTVYRLGKVDVNPEDILLATELVAINSRVDFETRSFQWIKDLTEMLNVPQQDLLIPARDNHHDYTPSSPLGLIPASYTSANHDGIDPELVSTQTFLDQTFHLLNPSILMAREKLTGARTSL